MSLRILLILVLLCASLSTSQVSSFTQTTAWSIEAIAWPEADGLFRQDVRWLGADDAYSLDLGQGRVLWLFADTFIATSAAHLRRESRMIRNSLAIQQGYDPSSATIKFYWRTKDQQPSSFFPESGKIWYWPGHAIKLENKLLIFLMKIRAVKTGLGFDSAGWTAVMIENPEREPSAWKVRWLPTPPNPFRVVLGSASILRQDDYIYAFSSQEAQGHNIYLVRWPTSQAKQGNLRRPEWWSGATKQWIAQVQLQTLPPPIFTNGQTEFTVHYEPKLKQFLQIQHEGFGAADLAFRRAENIIGPWSPLQKFYRPHEADRTGALIYACKSHPELTGAELILTYVVNHSDFGQLINDNSLYYPRFLKGRLQPNK